jgi:hypothetical protein
MSDCECRYRGGRISRSPIYSEWKILEFVNSEFFPRSECDVQDVMTNAFTFTEVGGSRAIKTHVISRRCGDCSASFFLRAGACGGRREA